MSVPRGVWELEDLPERYRAQAAAQLARRPRRRPTVDVSGPSGVGVLGEVASGPLVLDLPIIPWSLNDERSAHWTAHRARTAHVRELVGVLVGRQRPGRYDVPVEIVATPRGVRHDTGNSYPTIKAVVDALVDIGVLAGDTGKQIARIVLCAPIPGALGLLVTVRAA